MVVVVDNICATTTHQNVDLVSPQLTYQSSSATRLHEAQKCCGYLPAYCLICQQNSLEGELGSTGLSRIGAKSA